MIQSARVYWLRSTGHISSSKIRLPKEALTITSNEQIRRRFLFYVEQDYSFAVLRPLQQAARERGHDVRWLLVGESSPGLLQSNEVLTGDIHAAVQFEPDAVFAPGDRIPGFIPGIKVQVFHGLNEDKRGNIYPERGLFDLYCTEGPSRTAMLEPLARQRGYFQVRETGWLKLDAILNQPRGDVRYDRPQILYASTFTPRLSSAESLHPEIKRLSRSDKWQWLVTLHPKMAAETIARYHSLEGENLAYFGTDSVIDLLHRADIMVSDNSSILQEFLLLGKPVVTFRNRDPQDCMINITRPEDLEAAIDQALEPGPALRKAITAYGPSVTPYLDGASSIRVLDAVEDMFLNHWRDTKPTNNWRNFKMRQQLNYPKSQRTGK